MCWLVACRDARKTRAASQQEMDYGDAAAALLIGRERAIAEFLGSGALSVDFVDQLRAAGEDVDYHSEERWVRDEGVSKLVPSAIAIALK